jgi:hypothetical protein
MKTFNAYKNEARAMDVYIKLNEYFLRVGEESLNIFDPDWDSAAVKFEPANVDYKFNKFSIWTKDMGDFIREPQYDGLEFEMPRQLHKSVIRLTFGDYKKK